MNDDKIKLGVLWKNTGLDAAVAELRKGGRFLVLKNTKRPDKRDPDCVLYVVPDRNPQAPAPAAPAAARGRV
jgi:hypothetical protein